MANDGNDWLSGKVLAVACVAALGWGVGIYSMTAKSQLQNEYDAQEEVFGSLEQARSELSELEPRVSELQESETTLSDQVGTLEEEVAQRTETSESLASDSSSESSAGRRCRKPRCGQLRTQRRHASVVQRRGGRSV